MTDILAAIDAAVDNLCACGCRRRLNPDGPSAWFATQYCQHVWSQANATDPEQVYERPDAMQLVENDAARERGRRDAEVGPPTPSAAVIAAVAEICTDMAAAEFIASRWSEGALAPTEFQRRFLNDLVESHARQRAQREDAAWWVWMEETHSPFDWSPPADDNPIDPESRRARTERELRTPGP